MLLTNAGFVRLLLSSMLVLKVGTSSAVQQYLPEKPQLLNYFVHIPKAGGEGAMKMLRADATQLGMRRSELRLCNHANAQLRGAKIEKWATKDDCWMHAAESITHRDVAKYQYVVVRNPATHVISQYFHCAESKLNKGKRKAVPGVDLDSRRSRYSGLATLDVWLKEYATAMEKNQTRCKKDKCYNPENMQTKRILGLERHQQTMCKQGLGVRVNPNPNPEGTLLTELETRTLLQAHVDSGPVELRGMLRKRYAVVGITEEMKKSTCLVSIEAFHAVPPRCNCTAGEQHSWQILNRKWELIGDAAHAALLMKAGRSDHGVTHHGATFQTSPQQAALIHSLTRVDQVLYEIARELFVNHVQEVEIQYNFRIC